MIRKGAKARKRRKSPPIKQEGFTPVALVAESPAHYGAGQAPRLVYENDAEGIWFYQGDSLLLLEQIHAKYPEGIFDLIFADPPYFLSNGGITCHAGRMVSVNKGKWDKLPGVGKMHQFNLDWLSACQKALKPNGTIFVSGTSHVIHSVGYAMQQLDFKLLNDIVWVKPNPPPNLSCQYFTHATEIIMWAAKNKKSKHCFNYQAMRKEAGGKQMKSFWRDIRWDDEDAQVTLDGLPELKGRKLFGKRPTRRPLMLIRRLINAASVKDDGILCMFFRDPAMAVAARSLKRRFVGITPRGRRRRT